MGIIIKFKYIFTKQFLAGFVISRPYKKYQRVFIIFVVLLNFV